MPPSLFTFSGCEPCTLKKQWPHLKSPKMAFTPPTELSPYRLLALGEAPGSTEDAEGKQFVGKTGQYLRERLPREWKNKFYFQNCVRCKPPNNETPTDHEMTCCSCFLEQDLLTIRPQAILGLGNVPLQYFWQNNSTISKLRGIPFGVELEDKSTCWVFCTFHPSYPARADETDDNGEVVNTVEPVFRNDLLRFFQLVTTRFTTPPVIYKPPTEFIYPKSYQEAWNLFQRLDDPYAIDFETFKLKPYLRDARLLTAAFSDGKLTFAFPVSWPGDLNPWGKQFLVDVAKSRRRWIAQNASMELPWIRSLTDIHEHQFEDTEVIARLLHDRKGVGRLELISRIYLGFDLKALNNLDKDRMIEYPLDKVLTYNALDAWGTALLFKIMGELLLQKPNGVENYARIIDTIASTVEMELLGLPVDIAQSEQMQKVLLQHEQEVEKKARQIKEVKEYEKAESKIFNISSPPQVASVLTRYCGIQLPKTASQKSYSTDEQDLTPLIGKHPLVDLTLDFRELDKQLSTYIDPILTGKIIGVDGLIHPAYTTVHAATYRLSAKDPNIQNFPKRAHREIRRQVIAPEGCLIAAFDYAGLEARVLQMLSKDENLKKSIIDPKNFLHDDDIHWYWLHKIIDYYPLYMKRLADKSGESEEKKILKAGRTIIKTDFVFASFYGSVAKSIANRTQIPLNILEKIHDEFWSLYFGVRKWLDGQVEFYKQYGYVESLTGRIRNEVLPGNEISNTPSQGTGAEIVLEAQNALHKKAIEERDIYLFPRINIHDDVSNFIPDSDDSERYIRTIAEIMVEPRFPFITCPLKVECSVGYNWCDLSEVFQYQGEAYSA
jgi:uracil-DNA glycosylase family 4